MISNVIPFKLVVSLPTDLNDEDVDFYSIQLMSLGSISLLSLHVFEKVKLRDFRVETIKLECQKN